MAGRMGVESPRCSISSATGNTRLVATIMARRENSVSATLLTSFSLALSSSAIASSSLAWKNAGGEGPRRRQRGPIRRR
jgi:hypothetical protein